MVKRIHLLEQAQSAMLKCTRTYSPTKNPEWKKDRRTSEKNKMWRRTGRWELWNPRAACAPLHIVSISVLWIEFECGYGIGPSTVVFFLLSSSSSPSPDIVYFFLFLAMYFAFSRLTSVGAHSPPCSETATLCACALASACALMNFLTFGRLRISVSSSRCSYYDVNFNKLIRWNLKRSAVWIGNIVTVRAYGRPTERNLCSQICMQIK